MTAQLQSSSVRAASKLRLKSILVPTDFSAESWKALRYGIAFAHEFNAALWLIHVVEPPPFAVGFEAVPIALEDTQLLKSSERRLKKLAAERVPADIPLNTLVQHGAPFETIVSIARAHEIDMIIASTHGHTGVKRVLFGSTAERIVQHAPCPVLVVREREHEFLGDAPRTNHRTIELKRLLVPIDFSECSRKAVEYGVALAREFRAEMVCLHSIEIPYGMGEAGLIIETEAVNKRLREEGEQHASAFLQNQAASTSQECTIKLGTPYREIIRMADERQIDLIILGTHGRSGVRHFLLGSTAERVVRHAHCPVMVVREQEHEFLQKV
jgi:nucleotide-binding universal stress UspA family protein